MVILPEWCSQNDPAALWSWVVAVKTTTWGGRKAILLVGPGTAALPSQRPEAPEQLAAVLGEEGSPVDDVHPAGVSRRALFAR
jgi:hypothetical protein